MIRAAAAGLLAATILILCLDRILDTQNSMPEMERLRSCLAQRVEMVHVVMQNEPGLAGLLADCFEAPLGVGAGPGADAGGSLEHRIASHEPSVLCGESPSSSNIERGVALFELALTDPTETGCTTDLLVARCDGKRVISLGYDRCINDSKDAKRHENNPGPASLALNAALRGDQWSIDSDTGPALIGCFQPVPGTDWGLLIKKQRSDVSEASIELIWVLVMGAIVIAGSLFVLGVKGPVSVAKPSENKTPRRDHRSKAIQDRLTMLKRSERFYRQLSECSADGELVLQDGRIIYANQAFRQLAGLPDDGYAGTLLSDRIFPKHASLMRRREQLQQEGSTPPSRYWLKLHNGHGKSITVEVVEKTIKFKGQPARLLSVRDLEAGQRIKMYQHLIPTCCMCKSIRDDSEIDHDVERGEWVPLEEYMKRHSNAQMSHTYCPDCEKKLLAVINLKANETK